MRLLASNWVWIIKISDDHFITQLLNCFTEGTEKRFLPVMVGIIVGLCRGYLHTSNRSNFFFFLLITQWKFSRTKFDGHVKKWIIICIILFEFNILSQFKIFGPLTRTHNTQNCYVLFNHALPHPSFLCFLELNFAVADNRCSKLQFHNQ